MATPNFLNGTKRTCLVLFSPHSFKPRKNIPALVGTTHRKPEYSRDAQNVCAVACGTAHTFRASRDGTRTSNFLRKTKVFLRGL